MNDIHPFHQLLIALALGLLIGLQRQWAESPLGGIRTYSLVALWGAVCAMLSGSFGTWVPVAGLAGVIAAMFAGRFSAKPDRKRQGLAAEIAMLLTYGIGALVVTGPVWLAAAAAGALAAILHAKLELHGIASRFTAHEIRAITQFGLVALVIYPIVPDRALDPLGVLNPREAWLVVVLIVGISLGGYIAYKFFGERAGSLLAGILGGTISSTATTAAWARRARSAPSSAHEGAFVVSLAWTTLCARLLAALAVVSPAFLAEVWRPVAAMGLASAWGTARLRRHGRASAAPMPAPGNPGELKTALLFAGGYMGILMAVAYARQAFGGAGLAAVAFLAGIADMDAITLSTASLTLAGRMSAHEAGLLVMVALLSNTLFKGILAAVLGGRAFARALAATAIASLAAGLVSLAAAFF